MTHYSDTACPTCHALPGTRCVGLERFGGAHAARTNAAKEEAL